MKATHSPSLALGLVSALSAGAGTVFAQAPAPVVYQGEQDGYTLKLWTAAAKDGLPRVTGGELSRGSEKYEIDFGVLGVFLFDKSDPKKKYEFALYEGGKPNPSPVVAGHGNLSYAFEVEVIHASIKIGNKKLEIDTTRQ